MLEWPEILTVYKIIPLETFVKFQFDPTIRLEIILVCVKLCIRKNRSKTTFNSPK